MEIVVDPCIILIRRLHSANNSAEKGSSHPIFSLHNIWKNTLNLTVTGDRTPRGSKQRAVKATTFLFVGCRVAMCFATSAILKTNSSLLGFHSTPSILCIPSEASEVLIPKELFAYERSSSLGLAAGARPSSFLIFSRISGIGDKFPKLESHFCQASFGFQIQIVS